jgi:hypothetical protein
MIARAFARFWKDRLLRLAVPLMLYTFVLSRIVWYVVGVAQGNVSDSFWVFFRQTFITQAEEGPTWFIFALLLFSAGYTLWRLVNPFHLTGGIGMDTQHEGTRQEGASRVWLVGQRFDVRDWPENFRSTIPGKYLGSSL